MKRLLLLFSLSLAGCAGTTATGDKFYSQGNYDYAKWTGGPNPSLEMRGVNHSTPTRAGANYIKQVGDAAEKGGKAFGAGIP